jgi:Zn-finger nucleic acid-binding protein
MKCPVDSETLVISERNGVEIDYCPKCRGVWLDRGELDKVIERASANEVSRAAARPAPSWSDEGERGDSYEKQRPYRKKKESFLSDLFDF